MVVRRMQGVRGVFNAAWSGLVYYWTPERKLMQLSLMTLETKEVYAEEDPNAPLVGGTVSPDQRYVVGTTTRLKGKGSPVFQVLRLDLKKKVREVILEHPEISNPHIQFNPVHGKQIMIQNNVGVRLKKDGSLDRYHTKGCKLFVIDANGRNLRYVPAGPPVTRGITGHECFVADTGKVLFSAGWAMHSDYDWRHDPLHSRGNLFTARPGDRKPTVFDAPQHRFNHVCASRDGKYFVADTHTGTGMFENSRFKPVGLVIGNLETGKFRTLVEDTEGTGGGNQCTHTHPYLTADNRYVIYNSDPAGIPQVYAAKIPAGFLKSLD
jgi:Tol biopolymer transport system component